MLRVFEPSDETMFSHPGRLASGRAWPLRYESGTRVIENAIPSICQLRKRRVPDMTHHQSFAFGFQTKHIGHSEIITFDRDSTQNRRRLERPVATASNGFYIKLILSLAIKPA